MRPSAALLLLLLTALACAAAAPTSTLASLAAAPTAAPTSRADAAARAAAARAADDVADAGTRPFQVQVAGAHRSYRVAPGAVAASFLASADGRAALSAANKTAAAAPTLLNVTRPPLGIQADRGLRAFHLDAWADPRGGAYAGGWAAPTLSGGDGTRDDPRLRQKGWKVMADPDFDALSTCVTLRACLGDVKAWSDATRSHSPIYIFVEPRDDPLFTASSVAKNNASFGQILGAMTLASGPRALSTTPSVDAAALASLNREILAAFPPGSQLMTPARLGGLAGAAPNGSLATALPGPHGLGWPGQADLRGKVFVVVVGGNAAAFNAAAAAGGAAPAAFVASAPGASASGSPFADVATGPLSMLAANGAPVAATAGAAQKAGAAAAALAAKGFLVRSAADWGGLEPAAGANARRNAVRASSNIVFSDWPLGGGPGGYSGGLDRRDGHRVAGRCNPASSPNPESVDVSVHGCGAPVDPAEASTVVVVAKQAGPAAAAKAAKAPTSAPVAKAAAAAAAAAAPAAASSTPAAAPSLAPPSSPRGFIPASPAAPLRAERGDVPAGDDDDDAGTRRQAADDDGGLADDAGEPARAVSDDDDDDPPPRRRSPTRASNARAPEASAARDSPPATGGGRTARAPESARAPPARRAPTVDDDEQPAVTAAPTAAAGGVALEAGDAPDGAAPVAGFAAPRPPHAAAPVVADDAAPVKPVTGDDDAAYALALPSLLG